MQFMRSHVGRAALAAASLLSFPASADYVAVPVDYRDAANNVAAYTQVWGRNDNGQVVGLASMDDPYGNDGIFSFIYDPSSGSFTVIDQPPDFMASGSVAYVQGINNAGVVTGGTSEPNGARGFTWFGGAYSFFSYPNSLDTTGRSISDPMLPKYPQGLVIGYSDVNSALILNTGQPFIYDPATGSFATFAVPNSYRTIAQGSNASGQIVGDVNYHAGSGSPLANGRWSFVFTPTNGTDPMLGGTVSYFRIRNVSTVARGINDSGVIAAWTMEPDGQHSFVIAPAGVQEIVMPEPHGTNCSPALNGPAGSVVEGLNNSGQVSGYFTDASCRDHGFIADPAAGPTGTTSNGAYTFSVDVVANTPVFIDPPVALGYEYKTGAGDPPFATVSLPIGIGDNKFRVVLRGGESYRVNAGQLFDFRTHGYPSGTDSFEVRCVDPTAMLNPLNSRAFPTKLTFTQSGKFTGTQRPSGHNIPSAAAAAQLRVHEECLRGAG